MARNTNILTDKNIDPCNLITEFNLTFRELLLDF